ncbi:MAG: penicillin acylase family protein [Alphaproteobacteria bacterium]|nr:penicillin acylase family protein [Alphaproteobacteria bacterium]
MSWPVLLAFLGCKEPIEPPQPSPLLGVEETEQYTVSGLRRPAHVVYTEAGIPHIYAEDREDLYRVQGFVVARDRYFSMDLVRRLSQGRLSELLGDVVLQTDQESRGLGMTYVTDLLLDGLTDDQRVWYTAYADGFNDYIDAVKRGELPPPSEYEFAGPLVGAEDPADLLVPWTLRDVAAIGGTIAYRLGYETEDIGRTDDFLRLDGLFDGEPLADLRQAGAEEFWRDVTPVFDVPSAPSFGESGTHRSAPVPDGRRLTRPARANRAMLGRARRTADRLQDRLGRDHREGWGSNAWAVGGDFTADGRALMAGDGHLELDIPALMYQIGLDTEHLGGGDTHLAGLLLVGMPVVGAGTNGKVAWSSTQHSGDITDWYAEALQLDADGKPSASFFQGEWKPLQPFEETYAIADVPALDSVGRTETWARYTTFDGRWITDIEGRDASPDEVLAAGETLLNLAGNWVVPSDLDGDGTISAISFDFTGLDPGNLFLLYDEIGHSDDVVQVHEATRKSQALSQNLVAADGRGDVFYTGYEMVPCRQYLPRSPDGTWIDGADPTMLLDGTTYGGFTTPTNPDFTGIEGDPDPYRCIIPFEEYPHTFTPANGFVFTANQDPGGLESDGDLFDDDWHIGGPWDDGYRAETIRSGLQAAVDAGAADIPAMQAIQNGHRSAIGSHQLHHFLAAIDHARAVTAPDPGSSEERLLAAYTSQQARIDEVYDRLSAWAGRGYEAASGVETFYHPTVTDDERDDAVATTLFNVWLADAIRLSIDDEGFPGRLFQGGGSAGRLRILDRMLNGRGPGNPRDLASFDPTTNESVFWDIKATPEIEQSDEVLVRALLDSLAFLESPIEGGDEGGFGTPDMDAWIWGLRHQVEFASLVSAYVDDPLLGPLFNQFAITTTTLPLADEVLPGDPRRPLDWFPRPGDNRCVDAANPGLSGRRFRHGSGPVMRMVFALGPDGVEGRNIIPGGQSGLVDSPHFSDQAELWLANETLPLRFTVEEVLEGAVERHSFTPAFFRP